MKVKVNVMGGLKIQEHAIEGAILQQQQVRPT